MDVGAFHLCTNANGKLTIVLDEQLVFTESIKADLQRIQEVKAADSIDLRCLQFHGVSPNLLAETLQPWALSLTPFLVLDNIKRIQIATGSLTTILRGLCKKLLIQEFHNLVKHRQIGLFGQTLPMKSLFNVAQFTDKIQNSEVRTLKCKFCSRQRQSVPKIPKRQKPHLCYMCKQRPKDLPSTSTDKGNICNSCQLKNAQMSNLATDLTGKYAVVTGGRVKIGYQVVLKLLRDGCNVVVTTRFPIDAAKRYSKENDFHKWKNRLRIYPLDLQDVVGIYKFVSWLKSNIPFLSILINNAAQTIRRPKMFYSHLLKAECEEKIPTELLPLLVTIDRLLPSIEYPKSFLKALPSTDGSNTDLCETAPHFPVGCLDSDGQQIDLRPTNSWTSTMEEIPMGELLEVTMTNCIAPFILCKELKQLMCASPEPRRFIVNVSAMEGQFSREGKTKFHPHTNMAKAGLNMLTRTAGLEYREVGIYMTSVDTGWVTDERPYSIAEHMRENRGFNVPLTVEEGAARVYNPIAMGLNISEEPHYAVFLKDFQPHPW